MQCNLVAAYIAVPVTKHHIARRTTTRPGKFVHVTFDELGNNLSPDDVPQLPDRRRQSHVTCKSLQQRAVGPTCRQIQASDEPPTGTLGVRA
jgi:hypothetical protein